MIDNKMNNSGKNNSVFKQITLNQLQKSQKLLDVVNKKRWGVFWHSWLFYFLSWAILSLYAGKVCPFVDENFLFSFLNSLLAQVSLAVFITVFPIYVIRLFICKAIGQNRIFNWSDRNYIVFEAIFFLGWMLTLFFVGLRYNFLLESNLKLVVGSFMFGFFSVLNMFFLRHRYRLLDNTIMNLNLQKFVSIRMKFILISTIVLILVGTVIALVSYKNFLWLLHSFEAIMGDTQSGILSVFKEIIFIIAIFIGWMIITSINYSTNIKLIFVQFNNTIYNLFAGDFDNLQIPTLNDEFGVMGVNLDIISDEMKEKALIKTTFGKFVNPRIAELILQNGADLDRGGKSREIVVLFSDIRNFTNTTHVKKAEEVVKSLNKYFTDMVQIVEKYDGMIDKFIGDALMGLFGYDDIQKGVNNAVNAAYYMQDHLLRTNSEFRIGVGIGFGQAIVGLVGSPDRLDFTAIGDVINTASRLESATPKLEVDILIDLNSYKALFPDLKKLAWKHYDITVKGITKPLEVYGLKMDPNKYKK